MSHINRISAVVAAGALATLVVGVTPTYAQAPERPAPEQRQPPERTPPQLQRAMTIQGELIDVDTQAKMIVVKSAEGSEVELKYTEATEVAGSKEGVAGLATMRNPEVNVQFTEDSQTRTRIATRIVVVPKKD